MINCDSFNAEMAVAGSILIDESCLEDVREIISADDFEIQNYKNIFRTACKLQDEKKTVDVITIIENADISKSLVVELMNVTPTAANALSYAKIVKGASTTRRIMDAIEQSKFEIENREDDPLLIATRLGEQLDSVVNNQTKGDLISSFDVCGKFLDSIGVEKMLVPTGFDRIDDILGGGVVKKGLYILAARPGCGKTSLAINIAENVAKSGGGVGFVTLEMEDIQLQARRLASETKLGYNKIQTNDPSIEKEWGYILQTLGAQAERNIQYNMRDSCNLEQIEVLARKVKNLKLLVIDYLGLIKYTGKAKTKYEQTTETSNELKRMARRLNVPILCLAQLNREVEQRSDKMPKMSDLRDSGAIEQDADGIILLGNSETEDDPNKPHIVTAVIAKNRHGRTGNTQYAFYGNNCTFYPIDNRH